MIRGLLLADKLTQLGPRPTIASLSLGAGRLFRLHRAGAVDASADGAMVVDVVLPHNSLFIMYAPAQELWRHEVSLHQAHVIVLQVGTVRWSS